ncbi:MAG: hypothetical protein M1823_005436, partial [Watsoniomyces obsoletus]
MLLTYVTLLTGPFVFADGYAGRQSVQSLSASKQKLTPHEEETIKLWITRLYGFGFPASKE